MNIQIFFNTYYELGIIPCAEGTWSSESLAWQVDSLPLSQLGCPHYIAAAAAKSLQSCPTLCNPIDGSPPGSTTIPGILQARTLEWVAISFSNAVAAKLLQSCPTLCNPIDSSPPGSTIPGILQARTLEWVAISFSNAASKQFGASQVAQS